MDAHADYGGVTLSADIHGQPIVTAVEAPHRVKRAPPSRARANQARKETAEFNHKAAHILVELGWTTCATAGELGITQRHVQALIKQPCEALEVERWAVKEREVQVACGVGSPFFTETFPDGPPKDREPICLDEALPTREKVKLCMQDGRISQAEIARRLGISRQAVSKHVQALTVQQKRTNAHHRSR